MIATIRQVDGLICLSEGQLDRAGVQLATSINLLHESNDVSGILLSRILAAELAFLRRDHSQARDLLHKLLKGLEDLNDQEKVHVGRLDQRLSYEDSHATP